jgi:hypothetical protein
MHDRAEEYIFADGQIHAADAAGHARHYPAHLKVVRLPSFHIGAGQTWNVSHSHTAWPDLDHREELYVYVHVDRLIVEPGSSLEVHGNVFALECGEIQMQRHHIGAASPGPSRFEICILPTPHAAYSKHRVGPGRAGSIGKDGAHGEHSTASTVIGTPFGPRLLELSPDWNGKPGSDGCDGCHGTSGQNGGMTMVADIRIGALKGFAPASLRISAQAGAGLSGGAGGHGGRGGNGGNGADGLDGIDGLIRGGLGGSGGIGGNGGDGGRGGNGGLASHIFVCIPAADTACLDLEPKGSTGGSGGAAGLGGAGGCGGKHGALVDCPPAQRAAPDGTRGRNGVPGAPGKSRPGARVHVQTGD